MAIAAKVVGPRDEAGSKRHLRTVLILLPAIVVWTVLQYRIAEQWLPNSDNASIVLLGNAWREGHLLLHGWVLAADPFWTSEVPLYALATALVGVTPLAVPAVGTAIWVVIGIAAAAGAVSGRRGLASGAALLVVFAVVVTPGAGLLHGPIHVGTTMFCLVGIVLLYKGLDGSWWANGLAAIVLTAGAAGEPLGIIIGPLPAIVASGALALVTRKLQPWVRPAVVASVALVSAEALLTAARLAHGFTTRPLDSHLVIAWAPLRHSVGTLAEYAGVWPAPTTAPGVLLGLSRIVAVAVLALAALGLARGRARSTQSMANMQRRDLWLLMVLAIGICGDLLGYSWYAYDPGAAGRRLVPVFAYGALLMGRLCAMWTAEIQVHWERLVTGAALLAGLLAVVPLIWYASNPAPVDPRLALISWLENHHLQHGFAGYWDASIVTVDSHGLVTVRPVAAEGPTLGRFAENSSEQWYEEPADFVLIDASTSEAANFGVTEAAASRTFGPPTAVVRVAGHYVVLMWRTPVHLPRVS